MSNPNNELVLNVRRDSARKLYRVTADQYPTFSKEVNPKTTLRDLFEMLFTLEFVVLFPHVLLRFFDDGKPSDSSNELAGDMRNVPVEVTSDENSYVFNIPNLDKRKTPTIPESRIMVNLYETFTINDIFNVVVGAGFLLNPDAQSIQLELETPVK